MRILTENPNTYTFNIFSQRDDVLVFVTTRLGGKSESYLRSCNIGFNENEDPSITIANRISICESLNIDFNLLTFQQQVHEDNITLITTVNAGAGNRQKTNAIPKSDALITAQKGITLIAQAADCVPIAIYDPRNKVASAIHAGWKGTVKRIVQKTAVKLINDFGSKPEELLVGIGPSIGKCCFEVGAEVIRDFQKQNLFDFSTTGNSKGFVDLWASNKHQLMEVGVRETNIEIAGICTKCNSEIFYSSRKDHGVTGRFGIGIVIK